MKDMKDFVPKFLLDSVDEALETVGLSTKPTLYNVLTSKETKETKKLIKLVDYASSEHADILAVVGKYITEGKNRGEFDDVHTLYTAWDSLLAQVDKINARIANLETALSMQALEIVGDKERIMEFKEAFADSAYFKLELTDTILIEETQIILNICNRYGTNATVFFGSFTERFDSVTNYNRTPWVNIFKQSVAGKGLREAEVDEFIAKHRDDIDSDIFALLLKLTNISTSVFPGSILISPSHEK